MFKRLPLKKAPNLAGGDSRSFLGGLLAGTCDVRRHHHVRSCQQPGVRRDRLFGKHVEAGAPKVAAVESVANGVVIDKRDIGVRRTSARDDGKFQLGRGGENLFRQRSMVCHVDAHPLKSLDDLVLRARRFRDLTDLASGELYCRRAAFFSSSPISVSAPLRTVGKTVR